MERASERASEQAIEANTQTRRASVLCTDYFIQRLYSRCLQHGSPVQYVGERLWLTVERPQNWVVFWCFLHILVAFPSSSTAIRNTCGSITLAQAVRILFITAFFVCMPYASHLLTSYRSVSAPYALACLFSRYCHFRLVCLSFCRVI